MTPGEKNIVKSLVAVAWADGRLEAPESGVIEGLLCGFDATPEEEREILDYAKLRRTFENDIPVGDLSREDRELLLANAALLTHADGDQSPEEAVLITKLVAVLGFNDQEAQEILQSAGDGALQLSPRSLRGED
ncbi:MAG TPA: TerB family tellurite resistance protein [Polyangiaceae bacterium]|nr:TerB family tellurite resistance protein [Polyangiaceae bacterium]